MLEGEPFVGVLERGKANYFRFPPAQWRLALLFDGVRSYEEIADLYSQQTGATILPQDARAFAENMDESDFWYKTPQERNLALSEKLMAHRSRRAQRKSKINVAHISFSAWDPDRYLGWLDRAMGNFLYSSWCVFTVVLLFFFEALVFIAKWGVFGPDILLYYNFTHKTLLDLVQFWLLFLMTGFFHESAHGLTCKHYGGEVHSMGLMFLYLTPAFYVDVTETWISATKLQRLATIIAGIWTEMVICGVAMLVWINTRAGEWLHDFAYQIVLLTGIAVVVINLNPLIKLDGYYFLTEVIDIPDLKERSTAFLSGFVQSRVLRLPAETPVVPRRRVALFVLYALASGIYSYLLLFVVVRFSYNIAAHWLAEFALIPAGLLAFVIFRSRLRSLRRLAAQLWTRSVNARFYRRPAHIAVAAALIAILFVPLWRDREDAWFVVEPLHSITMHTAIPGRIDAILVQEGEHVGAGQPLLRMSSPAADSMRSAAAAQTESARFHAFTAEVHGGSIGTAAADENAATQSTGLAGEALSSLTLTAPAAGVVLTRDPKRSSIEMWPPARLCSLWPIPGRGPSASSFQPPRSTASLRATKSLWRCPAAFRVAHDTPAPWRRICRASARAGRPAGLQGIVLPVFCSAGMRLPASSADLPLGISGHARIFGKRRSLAERCLAVLLDLFKTHVW